MKALMKTEAGVGHFAVCDVPRPTLKRPDDVLIRVCAAGICGTDIHIYHDTFQNYPPVILGHEFSGVVEEVGSAVTNFRPGDRVVGEPHTGFCGKCEMCRSGKIQLCQAKRSPGWGIDGAFTDYLVMPELFLHHVPDQISDLVAALAEPMAIVTHEVLERGQVAPQDVVAVVGAGPIGILAAVAAKSAGASKTILLGRNSSEKVRFPVAKRVGVDHVINSVREDAVAIVSQLTNGRGADLVVEASGSESGINLAIDIAKKCGRLTVVGMPKEQFVSVQWLKMIQKVLKVTFNLSSSVSSWERALGILAACPYDLSTIVTDQMNIQDWESAFQKIAAGEAVKIMFVPDHGGENI